MFDFIMRSLGQDRRSNSLRKTPHHSIGYTRMSSVAGPHSTLAGLHVELRAVPRALDGAADQHAVRQRTALVRAAIAERDKPLLGARDDDALVVDVHELHLIDAEPGTSGTRERHCRQSFAVVLLPLCRRSRSGDRRRSDCGRRACHPDSPATDIAADADCPASRAAMPSTSPRLPSSQLAVNSPSAAELSSACFVARVLA